MYGESNQGQLGRENKGQVVGGGGEEGGDVGRGGDGGVGGLYIFRNNIPSGKMSIRLVKAALQKYCLTSVQDWDT